MREAQGAAGDLLKALADHVAETAKQTLEVDDDLAEALGHEVATLMAQVWGGQQLYMPKGVCLQASKLHQKIYDDWTGRNHREVARKHNVSLQFVYRVVKRIRAATIALNQHDLFAPLADE